MSLWLSVDWRGRHNGVSVSSLWSKLKAKWSACSLSTPPWRHIGSGGMVPLILTSAFRLRWVFSLTLRLLYTWETAPGVRWVRDCFWLGASLEAFEKIMSWNVSCPSYLRWHMMFVKHSGNYIYIHTRIHTYWYLSVSPGKCWDSSLSYTTSAWFHIVCSSLCNVNSIILLCRVLSADNVPK
jgi:hypothetical protein